MKTQYDKKSYDEFRKMVEDTLDDLPNTRWRITEFKPRNIMMLEELFGAHKWVHEWSKRTSFEKVNGTEREIEFKGSILYKEGKPVFTVKLVALPNGWILLTKYNHKGVHSVECLEDISNDSIVGIDNEGRTVSYEIQTNNIIP